MMSSASTVFFSDSRASYKENLPAKLGRLLDSFDLETMIPPRSLVAVKLHFGERGNVAFIRPNFISCIVDRIRALGAAPFLTDTNTLYVGTRGDSVAHIHTAVRNGFAYAVVNAPIIIGDGLRGANSQSVGIDQQILRKAHLAGEIVEADVLVSAAHFKGHDLCGFGGTLKNLGMGCASRKGKMVQHSGLAPKVKRKKCVGCGDCVSHCSPSAITLKEGKAFIDPEKCVGCGECIQICPNEAVHIRWNSDIPLFQKKMVEYAFAVLKDKKGKALFLNFLLQVSPGCDCADFNDAPIVPDSGILASTDPVAIDQASVDMVNRHGALENSCLEKNRGTGEDKFRGVYPNIDWSIQLDYAEKIGLGRREYKLISI
ncbi:MAG: DUF362 domain-containing protein [Pseudomonadota bacterium]